MLRVQGVEVLRLKVWVGALTQLWTIAENGESREIQPSPGKPISNLSLAVKVFYSG